jgi:diguanylate cyclase (GGDEF)-like protein
MIREIGERLASALRPNDFVGRFGGDEFVAIVEGLSDREEAAVLGLRLLEAVSQPLPAAPLDGRHGQHRNRAREQQRRRRP